MGAKGTLVTVGGNVNCAATTDSRIEVPPAVILPSLSPKSL
jgi:hypothetical protein